MGKGDGHKGDGEPLDEKGNQVLPGMERITLLQEFLGNLPEIGGRSRCFLITVPENINQDKDRDGKKDQESIWILKTHSITPLDNLLFRNTSFKGSSVEQKT